MKSLFVFFLALCATASAQTVKSLGYNTSNNQIVFAPTNTNTLTFTNAFRFSTNTLAAQVRTNLGLPLAALTNSTVFGLRNALNLGQGQVAEFRSLYLVEDGDEASLAPYSFSSTYGEIWSFEENTFSSDGVALFSYNTNVFEFAVPVRFNSTATAATTRTNLGLYATNAEPVPYASALWDGANSEFGFQYNDGEITISAAAFANTNVPTNTTNAVDWLIVISGTNVFYLPLYQ
jgi:hypothetical protein